MPPPDKPLPAVIRLLTPAVIVAPGICQRLTVTVLPETDAARTGDGRIGCGLADGGADD